MLNFHIFEPLSKSINMKILYYVLLLGILISCSSEKEVGIKGTWMMYRVIQSGNDVSAEHNPHKERYVTFHSDSIFESGGRPYDENTGIFKFNIEAGTLFLDSDSGPEDDSYWHVTFKRDTMHWQGYGSEWAMDFELIHIRKK